MRLVELRSENVKRLKAITIKPEEDENLVIIGGENEQGKTSAIDSISYLLEGKSALCDEPVNRNAEKARIVGDLGDIIVTRTITKAGGGLLTITNKDNGAVYKSPQKMLDGFLGVIAFDPQEFSERGKTAEGRAWQMETLKALVGLDFTEIDRKRKAAFEKRTPINVLGKNLKAQFESASHYPDAPEVAVSITDLLKELKSREKANEDNDEKRDDLTRLKNSLSGLVETKTNLELEQDALAERIKQNDMNIKSCKTDVEVHNTTCAALVDADVEEVNLKISTAEETNTQVAANTTRADISKQLETKREESRKLTDEINAFDADKAKQLTDAKFPIEGLSFGESGVTYKGLPFSQASSAESLRVSVSIGIAMNPKLKLLLIRNGSLLDSRNRALLREMAKKTGHDIWMEVVGKGEDCTVIIEDGEILGSSDNASAHAENKPEDESDLFDDI